MSFFKLKTMSIVHIYWCLKNCMTPKYKIFYFKDEVAIFLILAPFISEFAILKATLQIWVWNCHENEVLKRKEP